MMSELNLHISIYEHSSVSSSKAQELNLDELSVPVALAFLK